MTESNDIRSLLTSRPRARVTARDSSLIAKTSLGEIESNKTDLEANQKTSPAISYSSPDFSSLKAELDSLPQVGKRLAVHLEQEVRTNLMQMCDQHDLTPEIFLEAAIVLIKDQSDIVEAVVDEAKIRLAKRKRAGLLRRTIAVAEKYGG